MGICWQGTRLRAAKEPCSTPIDHDAPAPKTGRGAATGRANRSCSRGCGGLGPVMPNRTTPVEFTRCTGRNAMFAFLKRLKLSNAFLEPGPARKLVLEFDALDETRRDLVCEQLDRLWTWFLHEFDGPTGFLTQPPEVQHEFLGKLAVAEERGRSLNQTELSAYYYSAALVLRYLR